MTDIKQCMRDILAHESRAVAEIPVTDGYERAVGMIVEQVWNRHGKLITSGMGKAGQIAMKTREIVELVTLAKRLNPQLQIIVITGNADSELAQSADVCLWTGNAPEVCPLGLTPTTSTTLMTVIGDVLVVGTMRTTGFTKEQYALRHHGGYLGKKSRGEEKEEQR